MAPRWCSGVTRNLPENGFPANTRDRAARQEPPIEGASPQFIGTLLVVELFSIGLYCQVQRYKSSNPENFLF